MTTAVAGELRETLAVAAHEVQAAIRDLRELARGIHPALLEDEGLPAAVAALGRRASVAVETRIDLDRRLPRHIEASAYFTVAEALTNAARHAGASRVDVSIRDLGDRLEILIADDGVGGADPGRGSGLAGLADRLASVDGRLAIDSPAGRGTTDPCRGATPMTTPDVPIRAVVADDSAVIRSGVIRILEDAGIRVIREARTADELMSAVAEETPDLAVVDIRMPPGGNAGLTAALDIRKQYGERVRVLVLSQYLEPEYALRLLGAGAGGVGYLLKDRLAEASELADAARRVAGGGSAVDPSVVDELVRARRATDRLSRLTPREQEILELVAQGRSNRSIARRSRRHAPDRRGRDHASSSRSSVSRRMPATIVGSSLCWRISTAAAAEPDLSEVRPCPLRCYSRPRGTSLGGTSDMSRSIPKSSFSPCSSGRWSSRSPPPPPWQRITVGRCRCRAATRRSRPRSMPRGRAIASESEWARTSNRSGSTRTSRSAAPAGARRSSRRHRPWGRTMRTRSRSSTSPAGRPWRCPG